MRPTPHHPESAMEQVRQLFLLIRPEPFVLFRHILFLSLRAGKRLGKGLPLGASRLREQTMILTKRTGRFGRRCGRIRRGCLPTEGLKAHFIAAAPATASMLRASCFRASMSASADTLFSLAIASLAPTMCLETSKHNCLPELVRPSIKKVPLFQCYNNRHSSSVKFKRHLLNFPYPRLFPCSANGLYFFIR